MFYFIFEKSEDFSFGFRKIESSIGRIRDKSGDNIAMYETK